MINRIGNHVHVLYRYIAIAGNRSRCSGSQSVAEVVAVSVVKVVVKEKIRYKEKLCFSDSGLFSSL